MGIRQHSFAIGELYHCYNRGVEKRNVFCDAEDFSYFLTGLQYYNKVNFSGKLRDIDGSGQLKGDKNSDETFVKLHAYCLNQNHFHILLENLVENGVSRFMQKLTTSYVMYFNKKNDRSGALFQGKFKSVHIDTDVYLQHLGVYINLNNHVHGITDVSKYRSSMNEYIHAEPKLCDISLLSANTGPDYNKFANATLPSILEQKNLQRDLKNTEFID